IITIIYPQLPKVPQADSGKTSLIFSLSEQAVPGPVPTYEDVPEVPVYATLSRPRAAQQEDSIHYADIQVFSRAGQRSAAELRSLQLQNATEYATLNFPRARLKYDSKNGTLV
ncbi:uncharacterized protein C11orf52 homolog, partial [Pyrgilauda ruficollis]|uniref:uncharacterized protein C11orf52 homolog n=1 Tax=Pyrgilauda ruficollis TaxID=221976 RepID=UPI001B87546F